MGPYIIYVITNSMWYSITWGGAGVSQGPQKWLQNDYKMRVIWKRRLSIFWRYFIISTRDLFPGLFKESLSVSMFLLVLCFSVYLCQIAPRSCSVFALANAVALWQITIPSDHLPILLTLKLEQPNFGEKIIPRLFQDYLGILPLPEIPHMLF